MAAFDSFVVFAEMRTGSNFLEANLNALAGVTCHGEVFNPHFIGQKDRTEMFGVDLAARAADPLELLRRLRQRTEGLAGFRFFHDHDARVLEAVLADPTCAKIILTRNPVESYVSWKIAQATGQWRATHARTLKSARIRFDGPEFERHLDRLQSFQRQLLRGLQASGQTAFYLDYEDVGELAVLNGLAAFLGVAARLDAPDATLKKQNPQPLRDKVVNPAEMDAALSRLDRFNLARTPNFEPRRPPAIPSFVAAAGLLHMPVRGGPEAAVTSWLAALDGGRLLQDFTQKSLRQWKRGQVPHRSFTVVRHPLARAHGVYCDLVAGRGMGELRQILARSYRIDLPGADADLAGHRAGFVDFLRFARLMLSGQTGLRVPAPIATQSAILQGFAQFQGPDVVLREDRLDEGLDFLCREVGIPCPPFATQPGAAPFDLARVWDRAVEAAARDAYQRDYLAFGFGDYAA